MHYTYETTEAILEGVLYAAGGVLSVWFIVWLLKSLIALPLKLFD